MSNFSLQKPKKLKANTNIKQTREQKYEIPEQERQEYEREKYERTKYDGLENERTKFISFFKRIRLREAELSCCNPAGGN